MRVLFLAGALVACATAVQAQSTPGAPARVVPQPGATYVVPHGAGEAVRVTTYDRRPTAGARLDRYRGVRVFREAQPAPVVVSGVPAARVVSTPEGRFVRQGGAQYPVGRR